MIAPQIRWRRSVLKNPNKRREWTPGRIAAAKRAVAKEKEKMALFPEQAKWKNTEERISAVDDASAEFRKRLRDHNARQWKDARRRLRRLNEFTRTGLLIYWRDCGMPAHPVYLLDLIREAERGQSFWPKLRELARLAKIRATFRK